MGGELFQVSFDKGVRWAWGDRGRTRAHGNWVTREALVPLKGSPVTQLLLQIVARQNAGPTSAELLAFQEKREIKIFV